MCSLIVILLLTLSGCGNNNQNQSGTEVECKIDDIEIGQDDGTHYTKYNDTMYSCDDYMYIMSFNNYQCMDTDIEYDEESDIYTCIIKFKRIINNK